ncbi:MAG: type 4a pilus biogenesis protein PilO [Sedimentisphaerales bacterium]
MLIDNLVNLNRSTRSVVFTALIIIATIAMYNWIVAPHVTYLFAAQEYESAVSKAVEKNEVITDEVKAETKRREELYEQLARARNTLFTPDETKEFFSDLQAVSEETGCIVRSLNLAASEPSFRDDTSSIIANSAMLTVSGQYNSIIRLVEKLQNHPKKIWMYPFKIESIDFGSGQLKCDMTITAYTIQDKEAAL